MFYEPHNERATTVDEAWYLVRAPRPRLPVGHPVGWDYEAFAAFDCELDGEVGIGTGMHDQVIGSDEEVPAERDTAMRGGWVGPSSVWGGNDRSGDSSGACDGAGGRYGGDTGPRINIGVSKAGSPQAPRTQVQANGSDFRLMFVRMFLAEVGGDETPPSVLQGSYDQFIGYVRGRLDRCGRSYV